MFITDKVSLAERRGSGLQTQQDRFNSCTILQTICRLRVVDDRAGLQNQNRFNLTSGVQISQPVPLYISLNWRIRVNNSSNVIDDLARFL